MAIPSVNMFSNQPGGGLNVAMKANNALANENILRQINQIKKQYMPITTQAEAASKLAYANLMGPQFMAKLLGNDAAVGNMGDANVKAALQQAMTAGMGGGSGQNMFNQMQQSQMGPGEKMGNSLSNFFADKLKGVFGGNNGNPLSNMGQPGQGGQPGQPAQPGQQGGINPQLGNVMSGIAHVESEGAKNPYTLVGKDTGKGDHALGKYQVLASNVPEWTKEALGQSMSPQEFLNSPEAQEKVAAFMMNKHLNAGHSPQDVGSIWFTGKPLAQAGNVKDSYGTTPSQYVNKMAEGMNQAPKGTYAENAGTYKGTVKEGEKLGEMRAQAISDMDEQYQQAIQSEAPIDHLIELTQAPSFQQMRSKVPFFQDKQLDVLSKIGTPEEQKLVGDFLTTTTSAVANTVNSFRGRILDKEISMANQMKVSPKDTWNVMMGKLASVKTFNEMTKQRSRIASRLMQEQHLNRGEALEIADKQLDGKAIRSEVEDKLEPKVTIRNPKTGETRTVSVKEARKLGVPNV